MSRTTVIVTDGYVSCEPDAFDLIRQNLNRSNVFAFGIGSSVNRHLIEGMARCGQGEPLIVTGPDEAEAKAKQFREYIREPVLTQIEVDFDGFHAYDVEPLSVPDVLANRPVIVFGKYKGRPSGAIRVTGHSGSGEYEVKLDIEPEMAEESNTALRYLWARHRIKTLADYNSLRMDDERVKEVTSLGLTYNLLTDYTSFVAIDSLVRNQGGDSTSVVQPLPLPEGVSDLAVGSSVHMATASKTMRYAPAVESSRVPLLSLGRRQASAPRREDLKMVAPAMAGSKEGDSIALNQRIAKTTSGITGPGTELERYSATPEPKDGKASSSPIHMAQGQFRSDDEVVGSDVRLVRETTADSGNIAVKLLLIGASAVVIGLLLWRRSARRKAEVNKGARDN